MSLGSVLLLWNKQHRSKFSTINIHFNSSLILIIKNKYSGHKNISSNQMYVNNNHPEHRGYGIFMTSFEDGQTTLSTLKVWRKYCLLQVIASSPVTIDLHYKYNTMQHKHRLEGKPMSNTAWQVVLSIRESVLIHDTVVCRVKVESPA